MHGPLDRELDGALQRPLLFAATLGALVAREPGKWRAEMEIGDLEEAHRGQGQSLVPGVGRARGSWGLKP